jgi:hypothetical protein
MEVERGIGRGLLVGALLVFVSTSSCFSVDSHRDEDGDDDDGGGCSGICRGGSGGTGATAGAGNSAGTAPRGGASASGGSTSGTGGVDNPHCDDLVVWATGCVANGEPDVQNCDASLLSACKADCYMVSLDCTMYEEHAAGMSNELGDCLVGCDVTYGGTTAPTCANARGKMNFCDLGGEVPCDDASVLDRCFSQCTLTYDCIVLRNALIYGEDNAYPQCYDACELANGAVIPFNVLDGGFVSTGQWHGYAWTGTDANSTSTITPADFSAVVAGGSLCVSGTVAGTPDYSAVAMLGIHLGQATGDPPPPNEGWVNTSVGIAWDITNTGGSPLRIQVQGSRGETDPEDRWCIPVTTRTGTAAWSAFKTECWDMYGYPYNDQPLYDIMVLVPGDLTPVPFSFCVNSLTPR